MYQWFYPDGCAHLSTRNQNCQGTQKIENTIDQFDRKVDQRWDEIVRHFFWGGIIWKRFIFCATGLVNSERFSKEKQPVSLPKGSNGISHWWHVPVTLRRIAKTNSISDYRCCLSHLRSDFWTTSSLSRHKEDWRGWSPSFASASTESIRE